MEKLYNQGYLIKDIMTIMNFSRYLITTRIHNPIKYTYGNKELINEISKYHIGWSESFLEVLV